MNQVMRGKPRQPLADRFWAKVDKSTGGCWTWTASTNKDGYGVIKRTDTLERTGSTLAHRISWEITHGPIPDGLLVLHRCDNRRALTPNTFSLGPVPTTCGTWR